MARLPVRLPPEQTHEMRKKLAPATGLEPVTYWLTANRSTIELRWNAKSRGKDSGKAWKVKCHPGKSSKTGVAPLKGGRGMFSGGGGAGGHGRRGGRGGDSRLPGIFPSAIKRGLDRFNERKQQIMAKFTGKVLMVGYGSVAQCTLPILAKRAKIPCRSITVMDFENKRPELKPWLAQGVKFVKRQDHAGEHGGAAGQASEGGRPADRPGVEHRLLRDPAVVPRRGVLYINTSVELWDPYAGAEAQAPTEKTLYWRHMKIRKMTAGWKSRGRRRCSSTGRTRG
jgi:hypothetical protein